MRLCTRTSWFVTAALAALLVFSAAAQAQLVRDIRTEGNEHVSRDRIILAFGVVMGEELGPDSVRDGIRRLFDMGYFSDVRVFAEPSEDGSVVLTVSVVERARISAVAWRGNDKVDDSDIEDALRISAGSPYDAGRVEDTRVALLALCESKGFPSAAVEVETEEGPGNTIRVTFAIDEGTRVTVRKIRFEGLKALAEADLKKVMKTKEDRWWRTNAFLDRAVLDEDMLLIVARYRSDGYIDAEARGYETQYVDDGEKVDVVITVHEGALYDVSGFEWVGASDFAIEDLNDLTATRVGETYRPEDADETIREAYSWYGERGYIHARIYKMEDVEDGGRLIIRYHVEEEEPAHIGRIDIVGNTRTKEKIIRRELTVSPGDLYRTSEIIASQRKIANLGFFDESVPEFRDGASPGDIDLIFRVKERSTGRAGVGMSHTSEKGITGFLEISEANLFGNGQYLDLKWEFGKKSTEIVLGFTEPWFMDRHLSVGFDLYDTDDKRTYSGLSDDFYDEAFPDLDLAIDDTISNRYYVVKRERRGGDVRVGWPFLGSRHTMLYTKYTLEQVKHSEYAEIVKNVIDTLGVITDTEVDEYVRYDDDWEWRSGTTLTLTRRTTDRRFHPRLGSYTRASAEVYGGIFGGDVEYQRYIVDARKYFPSFWTTTLMFRGRAGVVTGYGDPSTVPDDTRFEMGGVGVNGIRGYDNRSILPEGSDLYGGRTMLLGTAELKFPITGETSDLPIHGLFFVDAGNTWESLVDKDDEIAVHPTQLYWGAGVGCRVQVPVLGNLGVDVGYGFDEDLGGEWIVHYQFGLDF